MVEEIRKGSIVIRKDKEPVTTFLKDTTNIRRQFKDIEDKIIRVENRLNKLEDKVKILETAVKKIVKI